MQRMARNECFGVLRASSLGIVAARCDKPEGEQHN
jgi:hypothetical protein